MTNNKKKEILSFNPSQVTKKLLSVVSERAADILIRRYGLDKKGETFTLEAIGKDYGITRERVRQVENSALNNIRKSDVYLEVKPNFEELKGLMENYGGIVHELEFLNQVAKSEQEKNYIHFLLVICEAFHKVKEDNHFYHRWTTDKDIAEKVQRSISKLCDSFSDNDIIPETELVSIFLEELKDIIQKNHTAEEAEKLARHWLALSKDLSKNPLGDWGLTKSPNVKMRGIRDYAYLIIRRHGSPMHFREVAENIKKIFGREAHPATCHNELIKDSRFVLVGRGLYALVEWGYCPGVVSDVIRKIISDNGPMRKDEIISKVLRERYVKENTIMVNLQNCRYFKRLEDGSYTCLLYTSPSPRDRTRSRMPSSA